MSTINNASRAMAFLPLAFSVVLMMIGVNLGLTLYPYLFLGEPMMSVGPVFGVLVGLWIGACFSIATWKWSRGPKVERSTSHLAIQRLKKLLIPVVAFLSGSAAMASAGAVGPILDLGVESSLTVPLMLLVSSGGGFALLVTIGLMVAWLHELDWFRDSPEIDRGRDSGALRAGRSSESVLAAMPDPDLARWVVWAAGLLAADRVYCSVTDQARERLVLSLLAGVVLAHLGWALLHLPRAIAYPYSVLEPGAASILLLPLGLLLIAPWREALAALPLALGVSRLGCLPYDCCYPTPWNALPELAGMVGLHFAARRWPLHATPIVLCGFGAIRLVSLPLRRDLAVEPFIDPAWIASAWIVAGVALRNRLGSAEDAREWFTEWAEPLLRALVVMLVVWLLFPLVAEVFSDSSASVLVASSGALARIIHEGRVLDGDQ